MRITTYEKGGNSLNPFIKLFVFLIVLGLFIIPVSAFEDNFDDGEIASDWTLTGVWDMYAGGMPSGSINYTSSIVETASMEQSIGSITPNYMSIWYKGHQSPETKIFLSDTQYFKIGQGITTTVFVQSSGTTTVSSATIANVWYKLEMVRSGSNFILTVYDSSLNEVDSVTVAFDVVSPTTKAKITTTTGSGCRVSIDEYILLSVVPEIQNNIEWGLDQYIEGDTASYIWTLENSLWQDIIYKYRIQILKDGVEINTAKVSQTGIRYQDVDTSGTYEAKLQYSGLIFTNWQSIDSDSVNVIPKVDSFINVPQSATQRTNFTVTYLYGSSVFQGIIQAYKLNEISGVYDLADIVLLLGDKETGTTYTRNMSLYKVGTYKIVLYDDSILVENRKYDTIRINELYVPPVTTVTNSTISSDKDTYAVGENIISQYTIDYTNYTTYNVNIEVYNNDLGIIEFTQPIIDQVSYIPLGISTSNMFIGNHSLRLTTYDTSGIEVSIIATKYIEIALTNTDGFGLSLSKYDVEQNEIFVIKAITPQLATIHIRDILSNEDLEYFNINGSGYLNYAISEIGTYRIALSASGEYINYQYITVHKSKEIIVDDEIIPDTTFQDNTTSLLNSPYLIGLLIMAVFLAIGATNGIGGTIVTGSIGLGIVCYMGIFPWILLVIEVLVVAALMAKGMINLAGD